MLKGLGGSSVITPVKVYMLRKVIIKEDITILIISTLPKDYFRLTITIIVACIKQGQTFQCT